MAQKKHPREARMRELNGESLSDRSCSGQLACLMPNLPLDGLLQTESLQLKPSRLGIVVVGSVAMEAITNRQCVSCLNLLTHSTCTPQVFNKHLNLHSAWNAKSSRLIQILYI